MRIAVISDVHANLHALDAVLASVGSVDAVWHLGDIVGYGPDPDGVVERLRTIGAVGVRGNHDLAACGGSEIDWFHPDARAAMEWTRRTISGASIEWLRAQPERRAEGDFTLVHGSAIDPTWEYVTSTSVAGESLAAISTMHGLNGHTHVPIAFNLRRDRVGMIDPEPGVPLSLDGQRLLLNPGSVGQPRDGDSRASYLVLDFEARSATWNRVIYDIDAVRSRLRTAGLPARLIDRLRHGI
jgi:predicted phosphodiesterase